MSVFEPWSGLCARDGAPVLETRGEAAAPPMAAYQKAWLAELLHAFVSDAEAPLLCSWFAALAPEQLRRLKADLEVVLREPDLTGETLDWREIDDVLREYAQLAGWEGVLLQLEPAWRAYEVERAGGPAPHRVDVRPQDFRTLEKASPAVQRVARELLHGVLPWRPSDGEACGARRLKKLSNRDIWQIDLPDGYRLRYYLDSDERAVYVVYLGPHPEGSEDGRERSVRARIQRRRHEGGKPLSDRR